VAACCVRASLPRCYSKSFTVLLSLLPGGAYNTTFTLKPHTDGIVGVSHHPCTDYIVTASVDKTWSFSNIVTGRVLATVADAVVTSPFSSLQVHPDGVLLATGSDDGAIRIWDIKAVRHGVLAVVMALLAHGCRSDCMCSSHEASS
jgi:WD40 repeat protein